LLDELRIQPKVRSMTTEGESCSRLPHWVRYDTLTRQDASSSPCKMHQALFKSSWLEEIKQLPVNNK
jgi:hypothetical protein